MKKSAANPLEVNHLCPLMTHSSPSRTALVVSERGSEPGFSGSVIEKPDSMVPSMRGIGARFCRFVHRKPRLHGSLDEGEEPLPLLILRAVLDEDRLVARVGRH